MKRVLLAAVLLGLAFWKPRLGTAICRRLGVWLDWLGRNPVRAITVSGMVSFALSAGISLLLGPSPPHIHDEFANLLAADTFAHGRLSNPPHPLWEHFEGIHILSRPAYVSKYPPGQGLILALGQALFGLPAFGLWLSAALACAAACWMMQAWLPPRWAALGGLLTAFHPQLLKWGQVYWGGSEALLGGALLLGAFRRITARGPRPLDSALMGIGLAILAVTRPFEGFVLALIVGACLIPWLLGRHRPVASVLLLRWVLPAALVLGPFFAWLGWYNYRVTGKATRMPYMEYEEQYAVAPFMVWQKPRPEPVFRHKLIRNHMMNYAFEEWRRQQTPAGLARETVLKIYRLIEGYGWSFFPTALWLALLAGFAAFAPSAIGSNPAMRLAAMMLGAFAVILMIETWMWPRYAAPAASLLFLLMVQTFRQLRVWSWRGRRIGLFASRAILLFCILSTALWVRVRASEYALNDWDTQRLRILSELKAGGGRHLIIVRYGPQQSVHDDWVHNEADIDAAQVIWAREMDADRNRRLVEYFKDRRVWLLDSEFPENREESGKVPKARLVPYPAP
jgi:hypothetical protein